MKSHSVCWLVFFLLVLSGCSSVRVSQDYDPDKMPGKMGTFAWNEKVQPKTGDVRVDNPLLDRRIRNAVEAHLTGRNGRMVNTNPDYVIGYQLEIKSKINSYSHCPRFGPWGYRYGWYTHFDCEPQVYQYDEERLIVDVLDGNGRDLLWRGTGVYRLKRYRTPQAAIRDIQQTVDRILGQFPPRTRQP